MSPPRLSDSSAASIFLADLGFGVGASEVSTAGAVRVAVMTELRLLQGGVCFPKANRRKRPDRDSRGVAALLPIRGKPTACNVEVSSLLTTVMSR